MTRELKLRHPLIDCLIHKNSQLLGAIIFAGTIGLPIAGQVAGQRIEQRSSDEARFTQRAFADERVGTLYHLNGKSLDFELSETPLPFLDWSLVEPGQIGWIGERGDVVPLNGPHGYSDPAQIVPAPSSISNGVRIRMQPPDRRDNEPELFPATLPWDGREPQTLIYDEDDRKYRLWYHSKIGTAYAESTDLIRWDKPLKSPVGYEDYTNTNVVYIANRDERSSWMFQDPDSIRPGHSGSIFIDPSAPRSERFKTTIVAPTDSKRLQAYVERTKKQLSPMVGADSGNCVFGAVSADGIAWHMLPEPIILHDADTLTVTHFDREFNCYVSYTRLFELGRRTIARTSSATFRDFPLPQTVMAPGPEDKPYVDYYANSMCTYPGIPSLRLIFCQVYNRATDDSYVRLAISRNGTLWHWLPGPPLLTSGRRGTWEAHFVRTIPSFVPTPDKRMLICYSANLLPHKFPRHEFQSGGWGVLSWRRDRLAALEATERGEFTTCRLRLCRNRIILNMATAHAGEILVQLFDEDFKPIPGCTFAEADRLEGDSISMPVTWNGKSDLEPYRGRFVYLRFKMRAAKLFAISAAD